jgi:hypothetical protein
MSLIERIMIRFFVAILTIIGVNAIILIPLCMVNFSNYVSQTITNIVGYGTIISSVIIGVLTAIKIKEPFGLKM